MTNEKLDELTRADIERMRGYLKEASPWTPLGIAEIDALCDLALAALRAPNPDWVSVPREPTDEWVEAYLDKVGFPDADKKLAREEITAMLAAAPHSPQTNPERPCTCHPDDNPPVPCPKKYALADCIYAASVGANLASGPSPEEVRERCAKVCDQLADDIDMERVPDIRGETAADRLAAAIRALKL